MSKGRHITILMVLGAALGLPAQALSLEVRVKHEAVVNDGVVRLGDVGEWRDSADVADAALRRVVLGPAPRWGEVRTIAREMIQEELSRLYGADRVRVNGADQVKVVRDCPQDIAQRVWETARRALATRLAAMSDEFHLEPVPGRTAYCWGVGEVRLRANVRTHTVEKRMSVWVDADGGARRETFPLWFAVAAKADVLVARRDIARGEIVDAGMFRTERVDLSRIPGEAILDVKALEGHRAVSRLKAGTPIVTGMTRAMEPVHKGQQVEVRVRSGRVTIRTVGIAIEDGRLGETVTIERMDGTARYQADVVGRGVVAVEG